MALPAGKKDATLSRTALTGTKKERAELIGGEIVMMAPPSRVHQEICGELFRQLANFLEGKKCKVYPAPFAVRLFEKSGDAPADVDTMVEPDISVVCDHDKLDSHGCKGAPDLVVEVLSPSTQRHDRLVKLDLYQRAGYGNTGLSAQKKKTAQVFLLQNGLLLPWEVYGPKDVGKVNVLDGCFVEWSKVFAG